MSSNPTGRFVILLDGDLTITERVRAQVEGCRVLAADGGIRHAGALRVTPELWLGDFDSTDEALALRFADTPRRDYPADKDMSDGEIAIGEAMALGASSILLCGALGGPRSDHAFLNIAVAARLGQTGDIPLVLTSGSEEAKPLTPGRRIHPDWPDGTIFSLACFSEIGDLTITGAKWPLHAVDVPFGSTFTLSNVVRGQLEIELGRGTAVAIAQLGDASRRG